MRVLFWVRVEGWAWRRRFVRWVHLWDGIWGFGVSFWRGEGSFGGGKGRVCIW